MSIKWSDMPETKRLREFVEKAIKYETKLHNVADWGEIIARRILAEIERLEKGDQDDKT